jgi:FKBP-type peptidyl-prolyl cis-trans isomerase
MTNTGPDAPFGGFPDIPADPSTTVHYSGTLIDGTEFDSSYRRDKPASFALNRVISGWTEALQLMQAGDKWQLFIPPQLGYGERSKGTIPPDSGRLVVANISGN